MLYKITKLFSRKKICWVFIYSIVRCQKGEPKKNSRKNIINEVVGKLDRVIKEHR